MKKKELKLIEENLDYLELIADHGTKEMKKIAMAILTAYYKNTKPRKKRRRYRY